MKVRIALIKVAIIASTTILCFVLMAEAGGYHTMNNDLAADNLTKTIRQRYDALRAQGKLNPNQPGPDITDDIASSIYAGISFDEAEKILKDAGFDVSPRPSSDVSGDRSDRYNVFAISDNMLKSTVFGAGTEVMIILHPVAPGDYSKVLAVQAVLITRAL